MITFKRYAKEDYEAVCRFLIELCRHDRKHINWNWARFEWMAEHPEFDQSLISSIGLWIVSDKVVGAAIYDMYFGEAFCGTLPEYDALYPEILEYAWRELKDETGLGVTICDDDAKQIQTALASGFARADQSETIMTIGLEELFPVKLPNDFHFTELDPVRDAYATSWLFWQGFDHGSDRAEFERTEQIIPRIRLHFNRDLSVAAVNSDGEPVSLCCLWYHPDTDYAYVEPVCTIPSYRGQGVAKAVVYEALNRARALGARQAYVISDMDFYRKLGFAKEWHYTFYWKKAIGGGNQNGVHQSNEGQSGK